MLLIYTTGVYWYVEVANTGIVYRFAGANAGLRLDSVEAFANTLQTGATDVARFLEVPSGLDPKELTDQLFGTTSSIQIEDVAFLEFRGETLLDNLYEVGTEILEVLGFA